MRQGSVEGEKPLHWIGSSKRDLLEFPQSVIDTIGWALATAQFGGKHPDAKPWRGEGPGVYEFVIDFDGDTFRAVYTVHFKKAVYALHCFQKKSPRRIKTAKPDVDLIGRRLNAAKADYEARYGKEEK